MRQHSFVKEPMCPQCVHISPSSNVNASSRTLNTKQMFWYACSGEIGNMTALWSFYILLDKASVQKNMFISYILVEPCLALFTKNLGQLHQLTRKKTKHPFGSLVHTWSPLHRCPLGISSVHEESLGVLQTHRISTTVIPPTVSMKKFTRKKNMSHVYIHRHIHIHIHIYCF